MPTPKIPAWRLQVRKPHARYETVETSEAWLVPVWAFRQYLVPGGRCSVRILNRAGEVVARATPKQAP